MGPSSASKSYSRTRPRLWRGAVLLAVALGVVTAAAFAPRPALAGSGTEADPFVIYIVTWRGWTKVEDGFKASFEEAGLAVDFRHRDVDRERAKFPAIVAEIKRERPDLVYSWGTGSALNLSGTHDGADPARHITDIPHVFTMVTTPTGAGLVADMAGSGRHVTGTSHVPSVETQLRAIQAYLPVERLGVIYNPGESNMVWTLERLREAAPGLGITLIEKPAPIDPETGKAIGGETLVRLIREAAAEEPDALYIGPDSYIGSWGKEYATEARRLRIPTFAATERVIREKGIMAGLVSSFTALGRFTGFKARQILVEGKAPGEIPIETLSRFSYVVNMKTARAVGTYPPLGLLRFAEIVEPDEAW